VRKSITEKTKERRRFPRIKDNIFISFQPMGDDMLLEAITKDISQQGLMCKTSNFMLEGTELILEICQPLNYNKDIFLCILAKARVIWLKEVQEDNEYLIGVKITKMNDENQNKLSSYVNNRLKL